MFKYIKWELKSLLKSYTKIILVIGAIIGLMAIVPIKNDNFFTGLISFAFGITVMILMFGTFFFGTKKVIDTFKKPTFMLESMISFPPYKILLAKYLLAIILNGACAILFSFSIAVVFFRLTSFPILLELIEGIFNISNLADIIKTLITMFIYSTSLTSLVTFCYILSKSLFPKSKGALILGIIVWYISSSLISYIIDMMPSGISPDASLIFVNLIHLAFVAIFYICTVKLIEDKLEIYN